MRVQEFITQIAPTLSPMAAAFLFIGLLALYFVPTAIAVRRNHHNVGSIFVINMLLGFTYIGWVVALAWSVSAVKP